MNRIGMQVDRLGNVFCLDGFYLTEFKSTTELADKVEHTTWTVLRELSTAWASILSRRSFLFPTVAVNHQTKGVCAEMKNRWLIAGSAVGIHICIGSVYAWSVLSKPLMQEFGVSLQEIQWTFSLAILFLGLSAAFMGGYVEKSGPRKAGLMSSLFFCIGLLGASLAVSLKNLPLLYLSYGVIGGIGLGVGYIAPVSTLVKWFPDKRGFATGIAIMGFGLASLVAGPLIQFLLQRFGLVMTFQVLAFSYLLIMLPSSLYLAPPVNSPIPVISGQRCPITGAVQISAAAAMKTWQFWTLWWMLFTNITCGIGLLSVASPMAQETANMSPLAAAAMVGGIGLINGIGRLFWASVSDYLGRANTYITFFILQGIAFYWLAQTSDSIAFQFLVYLIISCYGGGFSTVPAFLSDLFGARELSAVHGKILTAWAAAGVVGPLFVAWVKDSTQSYHATSLFFSGCFALSLVISILMKYKQEKTAALQSCTQTN